MCCFVGLPSSAKYDTALMICLLRNLKKIAPPLAGFDKLPQTTEINHGADLARVKFYRNMISHPDKDTISTSDFNNIWKDLAQVGMTILDWCANYLHIPYKVFGFFFVWTKYEMIPSPDIHFYIELNRKCLA